MGLNKLRLKSLSELGYSNPIDFNGIAEDGLTWSLVLFSQM